MLDLTGLDKLQHFVASFLLALYDPMLAFVAGVGKELYDAARGGVADFGDLVADWLGILVAIL